MVGGIEAPTIAPRNCVVGHNGLARQCLHSDSLAIVEVGESAQPPGGLREPGAIIHMHRIFIAQVQGCEAHSQAPAIMGVQEPEAVLGMGD